MKGRKTLILFGAGFLCMVFALVLANFKIMLLASTPYFQVSDEVWDIGLLGSALIVLGFLYPYHFHGTN